MAIYIKNSVYVEGASSAKQILDAGLSKGDGIYWLSGYDGTLFKAYCDMTTESGGWTCVGVARGAATAPTYNVGGKVNWAKFDPWITRTTETSASTNPASTSSEWNPSFIYSIGTDIMIKDEGTGYVYCNNAWGGTKYSWRQMANNYIGTSLPTSWPVSQPGYALQINITTRSTGITSSNLLYGTNYNDNTTSNSWFFYSFDSGGDTRGFLTTNKYSGTVGVASEADIGIGVDEDGTAVWTTPAICEAATFTNLNAYDAGNNDGGVVGTGFDGHSFSIWIR